MYPKGTPVVVTDDNLQDIYNAILLEEWAGSGRNPLVQIQTCIRYPIQTAIVFKDVPNDNPPLPEGQHCRLKVLSIRASTETTQSYAESIESARAVAYEHARQHGRTDCMAILERHAEGKASTRKRSAIEI